MGSFSEKANARIQRPFLLCVHRGDVTIRSTSLETRNKTAKDVPQVSRASQRMKSKEASDIWKEKIHSGRQSLGRVLGQKNRVERIRLHSEDRSGEPRIPGFLRSKHEFAIEGRIIQDSAMCKQWQLSWLTISVVFVGTASGRHLIHFCEI